MYFNTYVYILTLLSSTEVSEQLTNWNDTRSLGLEKREYEIME